MKLVLEWIKNKGAWPEWRRSTPQEGFAVQRHRCRPDFYKAPREASRSWMNVTMRLPTEDLENKFVADAKKEA